MSLKPKLRIQSPAARAWQRFSSSPWQLLHLSIVLFYVLIMIAGLCGLLPDFQLRVGGVNEEPRLEWAFLLGTDLFGRSVLFKVLRGAETAMTLGLLTTAIVIPLGICLGLIAGFYGGKIDSLIMWIYTTLASIPSILLFVGISYVLGKGMLSICVAMGSVGWVGLCRLIRGEVMKQKSMEYVEASRLLGANNFRLMFSHILPNVFHLAIVSSSLSILTAIKTEVILTYLGVGIQDGASWGTMVGDATGELVNRIWWPLFGVTVAMFLILYSLNVVGDALRDALDPKYVA